MMDFNIEEEFLISLREMGSSDEEEFVENRHSIIRHHISCQPCRNPSLSWLDLKVFYIRMSKCVRNIDSIPEYLRLNHIPSNRETLLEANGTRTGMYSNGVSTLLKRVRLDRQLEEVTFVCAESVRTMGSVKFEVFDEDVLILSGMLEMDFKSCVEVLVAGCFSGSPIVLRRTLQLGRKRKRMKKGMLEPIPECEATESLTNQLKHHTDYKPEDENHCRRYQGTEGEEEDGDLSWFNAGVTTGIGIGLSICLGVGLQKTT